MPATPKIQSHRLGQHDIQHLATLAWDRNPRRHDLEAIAASLGKYGYGSPILIDDTSGRIAAGHGVLAAMLIDQAEGRKAPRRVTVVGDQWQVVTIHIQLNPGEVDGYALSDTRTKELGGWDDALLLDVLEELSVLDPTLYGTGFTPSDLELLQEKIGGELPPSFHAVPDPDPARLAAPAAPPSAPAAAAGSAPQVTAAQPAAHAPTLPPGSLPAPALRTLTCPHCGETIQA
ncbi:hypothetical protein [Deinococcus soli (ex Cha et al. 2016)]|uniref:Uncharacterized protein n=1 Tax=Deinococcus soli (ex Cha et al. 2016) TaxID=1309411 RepID=A0ACC6KNE6_9DEIO|nr:hypothetical protein [Deinococcus soli (ex Cha et al. 2016)]MDR6330644.1 hypothetical protein [Deinococcus soli (ex Cha et al. 2016)]MDR6754011.1 hypothetical protein [Deinococcus soli (ex Cha et al. 2016)]